MFERLDLMEVAIALDKKYQGDFTYIIDGDNALKQITHLTYEFRTEGFRLKPIEMVEEVQTFLETNFSGVPYTYRLEVNDLGYFIILNFMMDETAVEGGENNPSLTKTA